MFKLSKYSLSRVCHVVHVWFIIVYCANMFVPSIIITIIIIIEKGK